MTRTKAGLVSLTILIFVVGGAAIMSSPRRTQSRGPVGRTAARVFERVPDHKAYEFLFHRITFHRKRVATAGKPEAVDGALQREGHLSLDQTRSLEIIATHCLSEVEKQDAEAHIVIKAFREKYFPNGKIPVGGELPPPPPELEIMQQKRDAILQRGRGQVLEMLGGVLGTLRVISNAVDRRVPARETHGPHQAGRGGTISGFVVDTEGKPVSQATVSARDLSSFTGPVIPAQADKEGRFTMTRLEAGTYQLSASKEEDGYPESLSTFNVGTKPIIQQITLKENEVSSGNLIRVGPKALKLFGYVVDAVTKRPVNGVRITLRRVDNPGAFLERGLNTSKSFRILVPQVPITVEVSAPGYEKKDLGTMTPKAGQINRLDVMIRKSQ